MIARCVPDGLSSWSIGTRIRVGWMAATVVSSSFYLLVLWLVVVLGLAMDHWRFAVGNVVLAAVLCLHPTREWPRFCRIGQVMYDAFDAHHSAEIKFKFLYSAT